MSISRRSELTSNGFRPQGPERAELFSSSRHAPSGRMPGRLIPSRQAISDTESVADWLTCPRRQQGTFAKVFLECQAGRADSLAKSPKKKEE